jgi:type IV pilus assembly protein PilN
MIRVNLLAHREERRKGQRRQLGLLAIVFLALGGAVWLAVHGVIASYVSAQNDRNEFLKKENASLDKQIEEIRKLRDDIQALLARKQIIEALQSDRARAVELLDQLVRQTPDGVYLKTIKQDGLKVNLTGYAQSNARVSTLMRNLQSSPVVENTPLSPQLVEIKATEVNKKRLSEFNMNFLMKRPVGEEIDKGGKAGKPAPAAAAKKG